MSRPRKPRKAVDLAEAVREAMGSPAPGAPLKKPGPLPQAIRIEWEGPSAADQTLEDRGWPEGYFEREPVGEDFPSAEAIREGCFTLEDIRAALPSKQVRTPTKKPLSQARRKALLKLDPFDTEVLLRLIKHPEAYQEVLEAVRLQAREACARIAITVARRRSLAGHEDGADAARQIANFIREDLSMEDGP